MCGITGYVDHQGVTELETIKAMTETLVHRGPNARGEMLKRSRHGLVSLGHTRLSILDLSADGQQPMRYKNLQLVFNGEIYNFKEIRQTLRQMGHRFKTQTDSEVILHAFAKWGVRCVERFIGMFAFIIYDQAHHRLYGFRDRPGVKPLYYSQYAGGFIFGSELKALHAHPDFSPDLNLPSVSTFFELGYIPGEHSVYEKTAKLGAGQYFIYDLETRALTIKRYWDARDSYRATKTTLSYDDAKSALSTLLKSACEYRMIADVPVGVFLSGGYDSTAVAALLQSGNQRQIKTFTIGFEQGNNEAPYARATAEYLGTDHYEYTCTAEEAQAIIPTLPRYFDEPFADSSAIPTLLVSRFAKSQVTVALSADGGDESFAGYTDYERWRNYKTSLQRVPKRMQGAARALAKIMSRVLKEKRLHRSHHLESIAAALNTKNDAVGPTLYEWMRRLPRAYRQDLFRNGMTPALPHAFNQHYMLTDGNEHPMLADYLGYLPDDILVKVDRATMSTALEGREPLLDHRVLEFAARLPLDYKVGDGSGKRILKDVVHQYVPKALMDRPKRGFSIPLDTWLRNDLNELLMDTLSPVAVRRRGVLNPAFVAARLAEFQEGRLHYNTLIWKLLMFQLWHEQWH